MGWRSVVALGAVLALPFVVAQPAAQSSQGPTLAQFDEQVVQARRVMRQYCGIAQTLAGSAQADPASQARALQLLRETRARWDEIMRTYAGSPPGEYAKDKDFSGRLRDIANAMADMERALEAGAARHSSRACGYACGLFVALHEDNSLEYPLDKLYHLRREIRTAQGLLAAKGIDGVRTRLSRLLAARDAAMAASPVGGGQDPRSDEYESALRDLSRSLDDVARAAAGGDTDGTATALASATRLANHAYGLAL